MNAIDYLIDEHKTHRDLLEKMELDTSIFPKLRHELVHHINIEETILYPRLLKVPELEMVVREAWEEHGLFMQLLQEMDDLEVSTKLWQTKFLTLKKLIVLHLEDEERKLFPKIREFASKEYLAEVGEQMEIQKLSMPTEAIIYPEVPDSHKLQN